jgi:hypothetical protein
MYASIITGRTNRAADELKRLAEGGQAVVWSNSDRFCLMERGQIYQWAVG